MTALRPSGLILRAYLLALREQWNVAIGVALESARLVTRALPAQNPVFSTDRALSCRASKMANSPLFNEFTPAECVCLARSARTRSVARDELVFNQGESIRNVFFIETGSVKLTQIGASGCEVIMWMRSSGDLVDIFGIPLRQIHSCAARAATPTQLLTWSWSVLRTLPISQRLQRNMSYILSEQLSELEERFHEVATDKVPRRVACALIRLCRKVGINTPHGTIILLSREELAQLTGTTLFTISRLMTRWHEQGLLEPRREAVLIRCPDAFLDLSSSQD